MRPVRNALLLLGALAGLTVASQHASGAATQPNSLNGQETAKQAAQQLLERLLPGQAGRFGFEVIPDANGADVFEIEDERGRIVLRGNKGVSLASALNWYLKYYAHSSVSWRGDNLRLPEPLPAVKEKIRRISSCRYRYCFNYCTFSYSLAWWEWAEWERMIDWMALHGINMPLAITGQEAVWQQVYLKLGLNDRQIKQFLVGPAYLPFGWMGCIDGWGGPLPDSWISKHTELQHRILARQRELGMTSVLQGFTGHVPKTLLSVFPQAKLQQLPSWAQFPSTYFLDPHDPLFVRLGKMFIEEQTRQFGTAHLYASDTFIEMIPPSNDPKFLASMGRTIYDAMHSGDPESIWVLQGWIFSNQPQFWQLPQGRAFLGAVPDDRLIALDLYGESSPVWPKTESFFGKPWIWCVLHNFGGLVGIYGDLPRMSAELTRAGTSPDRGKLSGIGLTFEGMDYNPIVQDLLTETSWHQQMPPLDQWVAQFAHRRYGHRFPETEQAWDILRNTLYRQGGPMGTPLIERPSLKLGTSPEPWRYQADVLRMLSLLLARADELRGVETYRFDLVNLTRELLVAQGPRRVADILQAHQARNGVRFDEAARRLRQLFQDIDELLATDRNFLLGVWLEGAKHWANTESERRLYEWNARNLITLWGPPDSALHEYAARQWSGMFKGFYQKRWDLFLDRLRQAMVQNQPFDAEKVDREIRAWEEQWTHQTEAYPTEPRGDAITVVRQTLERYRLP